MKPSTKAPRPNQQIYAFIPYPSSRRSLRKHRCEILRPTTVSVGLWCSQMAPVRCGTLTGYGIIFLRHLEHICQLSGYPFVHKFKKKVN